MVGRYENNNNKCVCVWCAVHPAANGLAVIGFVSPATRGAVFHFAQLLVVVVVVVVVDALSIVNDKRASATIHHHP